MCQALMAEKLTWCDDYRGPLDNRLWYIIVVYYQMILYCGIFWLPWTTRWWAGRGRDHKPPVHSCQRLWSVRHYIVKKGSVRCYVGEFAALCSSGQKLKNKNKLTDNQLKAENLLMINSKQHPQRSAAAIASLRAVLTRPGFNGAITWDAFLSAHLNHSCWLCA